LNGHTDPRRIVAWSRRFLSRFRAIEQQKRNDNYGKLLQFGLGFLFMRRELTMISS
jgi:hypothetical protein